MSCGYQGIHFGAHYEDGTCIDGYLWDLDSGDDEGLTNGGDIPCPNCQQKEYYRYSLDEVEEDGFMSLEQPFTSHRQYPQFNHLPTAARRLYKRYWMRGRRAAIGEQKKEGLRGTGL